MTPTATLTTVTTHAGDEITPVELGYTADDGTRLTALRFDPPRGTALRGAVFVAPAMATRGAFYAPLARWLAARGWATVTLDVRGIGSLAQTRAETADALTWARDLAAAFEAVVADLPAGTPTTWLGHSFGGQVVPLVDHTLADRIVLVASGSGYWRLHGPVMSARAWALWQLMPTITANAGYFPGRRIGGLGDLPAGVARQWARWCLHPEYLAADVPDVAARYAAVTTPVTSIAVTDDALLSERSIRALEDRYVSAEVTRVRLSPADNDGREIGHHGLFRPANAGLWERVLLPALAGVTG